MLLLYSQNLQPVPVGAVVAPHPGFINRGQFRLPPLKVVEEVLPRYETEREVAARVSLARSISDAANNNRRIADQEARKLLNRLAGTPIVAIAPTVAGVATVAVAMQGVASVDFGDSQALLTADNRRRAAMLIAMLMMD